MMYVNTVYFHDHDAFSPGLVQLLSSTFFHLQDLIQAAWWCNNHLEKYEFVNGKDYPIYEYIYMMEKKQMFETTNQLGFCISMVL